MARRSWFESSGGATAFSRIERLESWQRAIEDGIIEPHEIEEQTDRLVAMLRELEPLLDDDRHEKVTRVLEEMTVLSAMHATMLVEEFGRGAEPVAITGDLEAMSSATSGDGEE